MVRSQVWSETRVYSPPPPQFLFLVIINRTMRKTTSDNRPKGIQWGPEVLGILRGLAFADYLTVLSKNCSNLQEKTDRLDTYAKQTGFQVMCFNAKLIRTYPCLVSLFLLLLSCSSTLESCYFEVSWKLKIIRKWLNGRTRTFFYIFLIMFTVCIAFQFRKIVQGFRKCWSDRRV